MFENRVLSGIFGPKRDEETGEWRKLHNEELNDMYCSPNIIRVMKSRRLRWAGHVACLVGRRDACSVSVGILREGDHLEDQDVNGKIILKWMLKKWRGGLVWIDLAQNRDIWRALVNAVMNLRVP